MTLHTAETSSLVPGIRLRQVRERLGFTYRDVEQASFEVAQRRGRAEFIVRISRLADFENSGVVPSLYKLFSLCSIYHLSPDEVCGWYDIPMSEVSSHAGANPAPNTHLAAPPRGVYLPIRFDPAFDPQRTTYLTRMVQQWGRFEAATFRNGSPYHYGYVGLTDHWMEPLLRPGALVLVDPRRQRVDAGNWRSEAERPIYLIDIRSGYRCCWCGLDGNRLVLQPHPLSPCVSESYHFPDEAEVVGRVIGVSMRLVDA
ncbi:MAG TPA: helix-turn-helix transcriptional regulator [Candidatus Acidoferrales bacterium]|nr:helix-turn-helix transcriptional regulator [Candidatus Acidoferrales bacterium]